MNVKWCVSKIPQYIKVDSREIPKTGSNGEQPFLNVTHRLDLIYMHRKYYQNIKGVKVMDYSREITKQGRANLACKHTLLT